MMHRHPRAADVRQPPRILPMEQPPRARPWLDRACLAVAMLAFIAVPGRALVALLAHWIAG